MRVYRLIDRRVLRQMEACSLRASVVGHDVPAGQKISGSPAFDNRQWLRATAVFERLPELQKTVRELRNRFAAQGGEENASESE